MTESQTRQTPEGDRQIQPPRVPFWHMKVAADGGSMMDRAQLDGFMQRVVSGDTPPIWMRRVTGRIIGAWFTVLPVGWTGDWHESPEPQWVITISGRWFTETQDGKRVEMGPGEVKWGGDLGTAGNMGHRSGQIGEEPCVQLLVQFAREEPDIGPAD